MSEIQYKKALITADLHCECCTRIHPDDGVIMSPEVAPIHCCVKQDDEDTEGYCNNCFNELYTSPSYWMGKDGDGFGSDKEWEELGTNAPRILHLHFPEIGWIHDSHPRFQEVLKYIRDNQHTLKTELEYEPIEINLDDLPDMPGMGKSLTKGGGFTRIQYTALKEL